MKERTIVKFSGASLKEALQSVLPIFAIVLLLSVSVAPMQSGILVTFLFGTLLLILGMNFFTIGSGISMPHRCASSSTASIKVTFSCSITNWITLPPRLQE
jgi:hypothetical protein